jgi:ring-1,2-phenylacetyl-CoA epoxidase subunit PaaD
VDEITKKYFMTNEDVMGWLADVTDPEVPALTILDLGIVRNVKITEERGETAVKLSRSSAPPGPPTG